MEGQTSQALGRLQQAVEAALDSGALPEGETLGLVCPVVPEELPHAFGLNPVRLVLPQRPPTRTADALQSFCCTWVQGLLDRALAGELDRLWGVILPCNTCDSLQNLGDIWARARPDGPRTYSLRLPVLSGGAAAQRMLAAELRRWQGWLEQQTGARLDPDHLAHSARLFNRVRAALRRLQTHCAAGRIPLSQLHAAALAAQTRDRRQVAAELEAAADELDQVPQPFADHQERVRLVLVGGMLDQVQLVRWLDEHGVQVVADDTCALQRTFEGPVDLDPDDPLADLARRHLRRSLCPVRSGSGAQRAARLLQAVRRHQAHGVLMLPYRGCEPHGFDNVLLAEALDAARVPHISLELDPQLSGWGQLQNRLQAFLEMISLGDLDD
jgi:benzoyl-CoA reductase/2-hydroxyglutaryl-CoA dehydratase subunit BcrC/BadD/HgdB